MALGCDAGTAAGTGTAVAQGHYKGDCGVRAGGQI
jgi:hypothetical protein